MESLEESFQANRKFFEDFTAIIGERVELEEQYSKGIDKISQKLSSLAHRGFFNILKINF